MPSSDVNIEAYRQASDDLRHFSSLRFTVLGVFVTISSGLYVFVERNPITPAAFAALALFAIDIALVFSILEWRINTVAEFYAKKIDKLALELGMSPTACSAPEKTDLGRWLASILLFVIYGGSTIMWLYAWLLPNGFVLK